MTDKSAAQKTSSVSRKKIEGGEKKDGAVVSELTLNDLNEEDKRRVKELVDEMLKFGAEKEFATKELQQCSENINVLKERLHLYQLHVHELNAGTN